jgi:Flp pilus assembly protein TadD
MIESKSSRDLNNDAFRLMLDGQIEAAREGFQRAIEADPQNSTALSNLGFLLTQLDELEAATETLERAVALDPRSATAANNLGNALFRQGRYDEAIVRYRDALAIDPDDTQARLNLAVAHHQAGRLDEALDGYVEYLARRPDDPSAHNNVGLVHEACGRLEEATRAFRAATALQPAAAYLLNLGFALFVGKDYAGAAAAFERAKRVDPDDWIAPYQLALALAAQQKAVRAIAELEAVRERHPVVEPVRHSLAALYLAVGYADDAAALLEELVDAHPEDEALRADLETARRMQRAQKGGPDGG